MAMVSSVPRIMHPYPEPQHQTTPRRNATTLLFANLIDVDWDKLDFMADPRRSMAKEMPSISPDGRVYTIQLRDDLRWSDGKPITAEDFVYAFGQASKPDYNFIGLSDLERLESVSAGGAGTVVITLKQAMARPLVFAIFEDRVRPLPRHIWEGLPWYDTDANPEIMRPTVVNGPFVLKEIGTDSHTYARNPYWWGKQPNVDQVVVIGATPNTVVELLRTQQVDWAENVPPGQFADLKTVSNIQTIEMAGAIGTYRVMQFNLRRPLLSDRRVREALVRAIRREDLIQFEDDLAFPQFSLYPPANTRWVNNKVEKYTYDLNRARQLLEQAGFRLEGNALRDASGQQVALDILWPTSSQPRGKIAAYLQQQWRQLGIEATVTAMEFTAFTDRYLRQRDFDVAMGSFSSVSFDPDAAKNQVMTDGPQNAMGYSNLRVDELFERGALELDEQRRKQIYDELQRMVVEDLPLYYMVATKDPTAFDRKVRGVSPLRGGHILRQNNLQILDWYLQE
jgi:peptide/nickel transport system substrate-binding protein